MINLGLWDERAYNAKLALSFTTYRKFRHVFTLTNVIYSISCRTLLTKMHMGQSVRLQGDRPKCGKKWHILIKNLMLFQPSTLFKAHHMFFFFYTNESQSFAKALSFKSALKIPQKIKSINAALSEVFFFYTFHVPGHQYLCLYTPMQTYPRIPWFDPTKGLRSKRQLFNTFTVLNLT